MKAYVCPDCKGPSLNYKGSEHGWRCTSCVEHAIGLTEVIGRAEREVIGLGPIPTTPQRRWGGGGLVADRSASPTSLKNARTRSRPTTTSKSRKTMT